MIDYTEDEKRLARKILADNEGDPTHKSASLRGERDHTRSIQLILAAIRETTERAAKMLHNRRCYSVGELMEDLRNNEHLKGDRA